MADSERRDPPERLAVKYKPLGPLPVFPRLVAATRDADQLFESGKTGGGGTRHWLRECFLPALEREGLAVVDAAVGLPTEEKPT